MLKNRSYSLMMTILLACLGLFGLATYAAQQRIKEIGIRKVVGASVISIVALLRNDFLTGWNSKINRTTRIMVGYG